MSVLNDFATKSLNRVHLNNIAHGSNPMPMKSQTSSNENTFSMMRQIFQRSTKTHPENTTIKRGKNTLYQDHSQYLQKKKGTHIGKSMYNDVQKFNSNPTNDVKDAVRRLRSSGYRTPPKYNM